MRSITISNNKIKNTGVLFEILARQITSDIVEGQSNSHALNLMKKYFGFNKELGKELQLYQACINCNKLNETRSIQFLDMVLAQRKKLDNNKLNREKYELIKEIKKNYDLKKFLSCKIPSYKIYASIYKTFLSETVFRDNSIVNIQDVASARFALLEHFLGHGKVQEKKESALLEEFKNQTEDLRLLTYKILINNFNEKYKDLNDKQKSLLKEYINDLSNKNTILNYIKKEVPVLQKELSEKAANIEDKVIRIKLNEVISQLNTVGKKPTIQDNEITSLMIAYQIAKEMELI